jgi:hypothetical protein
VSGHLERTDVAGIAMLDATDPERMRAQEHAAGCDECRKALDEAGRALARLDDLAAPPAPSPDVLARARDAVQKQLLAPSTAAALGMALLPIAAFGLVLAGAGASPEIGWIAASALVLLVLADRAFASWTKGDSKGAWRTTGLSVAVALALVLAEGFDAYTPSRSYDCMLFELAAGALPLVTAMVLVRLARLAPSAASLSASAATGALAGQLAMHAACGDRHAGHVLAFHLGGVVAAALVGAIVGSSPLAKPSRA